MNSYLGMKKKNIKLFTNLFIEHIVKRLKENITGLDNTVLTSVAMNDPITFLKFHSVEAIGSISTL